MNASLVLLMLQYHAKWIQNFKLYGTKMPVFLPKN